jgi:hypothetical protein
MVKTESPTESQKEKICPICQNRFILTYRSQKLCSKSCYNNQQKINQRNSYLKNKDKIIEDRKQNPEKWKLIWKKEREKSRDQRLSYGRKYKLENKEKIKIKRKEKRLQNPEKTREDDKKNYNQRKERGYHNDYFSKNKTKIYKTRQDWVDKNRDKLNKWYRDTRPEYIKNRLKTDPVFKILNNVRTRLKKYLQINNLSKFNKTMELVGCTPQELKLHIEKHFLPGMSWDNYNYKTWHIDHIKPLRLATTMEDVIRLKLMHYTNFQPKWAADNRKKSDYVDGVRARDIKPK